MRPRVKVYIRVEVQIYENRVTDLWKDMEALIRRHGGPQSY